MQNTKLRKAEKDDVLALAELLRKSNYSFDNKMMAEFPLEKLKNFIEGNLIAFTLYTINNELKGFAIGFSSEKPLNKNNFFKRETTIFEKIKKIFSSEVEISLEKNCFYIEYIYFSNETEKNKNLFVKYLEMEKLKNNCNKMIVNE